MRLVGRRGPARRSVATAVAIQLVFLVLLSCLIPIPVVYLAARAEWRRELRNQAEALAGYLAQSLEIPLWEIDEEGRHAVVEAYANNQTVARVRVWDSDGTLLEDRGDPGPGPLVTRRAPVVHDGLRIGTVEVALDTRFTAAAARRILWSNVLVMVVVAVAIAWGALILVGQHVRRPLEELGRALDRLAEGDYRYEPPARMPDEFQSVLERFRRMARRVREREHTLAETNRQLELEMEERRRAEERYRALFENALEGIFVSTPAGRYITVNPALARMYEYDSPDDLIRSVEDIRTQVYARPERRDEFLALLDRDGTVRDFAMEARTRTGRRLDLVVNARAFKGPDGRIQRIQGSVLDVTRQKAMEARMRQAQKMEAVGTLAGGVAHDFNNLLQAILGYAELLLDTPSGQGRARRALEGIRDAAIRGKGLTEQLLAFSRQAPPRKQLLDLNAEIRSVFQWLERTLPRMIRLELDLHDRLRPVWADPSQVDQVLMNLALNARDAMPEGGVLTVRTAEVEQDASGGPEGLAPGRYVEVTVSDTGEGIDPEVLEHIFEPFFTTKEVGKGTGLGLATVYGIVQEHGGTVVCESAPARGTVFRVYFPCAPEELPDGVAEPQTGAGAVGRAGTVLVVDDEELVRDVCAEVLRAAGYRVLTAPDGETALEVYASQADRIDLVLLDLGMPGMGGRRCLRELLSRHPGARVVVATGYLAGNNLSDLVEEGALGVLHKPYRATELVRVVEEALRA